MLLRTNLHLLTVHLSNPPRRKDKNMIILCLCHPHKDKCSYQPRCRGIISTCTFIKVWVKKACIRPSSNQARHPSSCKEKRGTPAEPMLCQSAPTGIAHPPVCRKRRPTAQSVRLNNTEATCNSRNNTTQR